MLIPNNIATRSVFEWAIVTAAPGDGSCSISFKTRRGELVAMNTISDVGLLAWTVLDS